MSKRPVVDALRPVTSRKPLLIGLVVVLVLIVGAVLAVWLGHRSDTNKPKTEQRTAPVERTSLASGFKLSGYLGYGEAHALTGANGLIVTKVPEAGASINAGQVIMEVEGAPVILLQGELPLWRDIKPGVTGVDVQNLRDSLAKLGIDAGQGQAFDATLSAAIATMYKNAGYEQPPLPAGAKDAQDAAKQTLDQAKQALSEAQSALTTARNSGPDQTMISQAWTAYQIAVGRVNDMGRGVCMVDGQQKTCTLDVINQIQNDAVQAKAAYDQLNQGVDTTAQQNAVNQAQDVVNKAQQAYDATTQVSVGPANILIVPEPSIRVDEVQATVGQPIQGSVLTWTKTVLYGQATLTDAQQRLVATGMEAKLEWSDGTSVGGTVGEITEAKLDTTTGMSVPASVRVDVTDQTAVAEHGPSAVTISFIQQTSTDTLVVPVTALIVPAEGGYVVQRPDGSFVRVTLGLTADTRVEVFSDNLKEGDLVVVP